MIDEKIQELKDELLALNERAQTIQATADATKRPLSEDENKEVTLIFASFEDIEAEIERREVINAQTAKLTKSRGRQAEPNVLEPQNKVDPDTKLPTRSLRQTRIEVIADKGRWGWKHMGEFAMKVRQASHRGSNPYEIDQRLTINAPTSVSVEGEGADGGFAVPPDFRAEIWQKVTGEDSLLSLTDGMITSKNSMTLPKDETTPWDTSSGPQVYFESEAGQMTQSKIALKEDMIKLNKATCLVPVTEELMEDAPGLDSYLRDVVAKKYTSKFNLKIVQGTGAGEPYGILTHPSHVSVAKETGQAADTVVAENINKMYARMYAPLVRDAVWLINQDIQPQLDSMTLRVLNAAGTDYVGGGPVYMPPGGLSDAPYGRLKGRPVIPVQACETLGDKGDIIFVNLKEYRTIMKTGGMRTDISMHLWFDYAIAAYRFIVRMAGQPKWSTYISPRDGTNYLSWAVTLDERAGG